jgi:starch phosphorylase
MLDDFLPQARVAYFSMEIGLQADIPTYSGGLGMLAGDTLRTAADLELPMVAVSLVSRRGYFRQAIDAQGRQVEQPEPWEPARFATPLEAKITVPCEGRRIWVGGWLYVLESRPGGRQPVILLDTDLDENGAADRGITHHLYGGDDAYRLRQEIVLGIGGVRMLHALGFDVSHYHMNEGHSALLTVELLRRNAYAPEDVRPGEPLYDVPRVREACNFTTHTPVEAGHDKFSYDLVARVLGDYLDLATLKAIAGQDQLNMTCLALNLSDYVNGVARRHAETSRRLFPGYRVRAITNGVHPLTWTSPGLARLYDEHLPGWCHEPEVLARADRLLPDELIWAAHAEAKNALIATVKDMAGVALRADVPILGFARRMTGYKRPDLLFSDLPRLKAIAARTPFQVVLAGKAHPKDEGGKRLIEALHAHLRELRGSLAVAYLPNYDMSLARTLVAGVDVWLNTPLRPLEASGTSGMKAALNGVPSLSVLDGWWVEGCIEGVTGWAVGNESSGDGDDAAALFRKLEEVVLPLYAPARRAEWIALMKGAISKNGSYFNSHRMMRRYVTEAYRR